MAAPVYPPARSAEASNYETSESLKDEANSGMVDVLDLDNDDYSSSSSSSSSSVRSNSDGEPVKKTIISYSEGKARVLNVGPSSSQPPSSAGPEIVNIGSSGVERVIIPSKPLPTSCEIRWSDSPNSQPQGGHQNAGRQEPKRLRFDVNLGPVRNQQMGYYYSPYPYGPVYQLSGPGFQFGPTYPMGQMVYCPYHGIQMGSPHSNFAEVELTLGGPHASQDPFARRPEFSFNRPAGSGFPELTLALPYGQIPPGFGEDEANDSGLDLSLRL